MNHLMSYKGYHAKIEYDAVDSILVGHVVAINDTLAFEGSSLDELTDMFHETIDDYLELCAELGKEPDKEYKGSFNVRISPSLHKQCALKAESQGQSLNQFVSNAIENAVNGDTTVSTTIILPSETISKFQTPVAPRPISNQYQEEYQICQSM